LNRETDFWQAGEAPAYLRPDGWLHKSARRGTIIPGVHRLVEPGLAAVVILIAGVVILAGMLIVRAR